jgi:hypothetical protein
VCTGDRVRARTADRRATAVEGVLHLRHVPSLGYVQVLVLADEGTHSVDPASIEVIQMDTVQAETLERDDPLRNEPGWRPVRDLEDARAAGLVQPARDFHGVTWADLFAGMDLLVQPLLDAGWKVTEKLEEASFPDGDSSLYSLERAGELIDLERFEDGAVVVHPGGDGSLEDSDGEPTEPLFTASRNDDILSEFASRGWLTRAG